MLQGKGSSFLGYSLSLNKSFLDKRLTLSAFASNFLEKYQRYESHTEGAGFRSDSWNRYPQASFGLSVSYRLGELKALKASVKKVARSITNDDVKSGGSEGGGNMGGGQ